MNDNLLHAVTGAFGYSGKYIAKRLLAQGSRVRTLTNSPHRHNPFGQSVEVQPFNWQEPEKLAGALAGVSVLFNTYWLRFNTGQFCFAEAIENSRRFFAAARTAGVRRIVHVSITHPDEKSDSDRQHDYLELRGDGAQNLTQPRGKIATRLPHCHDRRLWRCIELCPHALSSH